ncbi:carbohydrate ABC transporter permease [soil metagenome]
MRSAFAWTKTPYYVLTGGLAIIFLFPLLWSAIASVSPQPGTAQTVSYGLGNYATLFDFQAGLPTFLLNSVIVSGLTVAVTLTVSALGGYGFANFDFPGKEVLFLATLAILMVPSATLLIPLFILLRDLGLGNSLVGLSLVLAMYQLPFATFMMRISFASVPRELEESALCDGAGTFDVLRRIMLPLVVPGLITVALFAFLAAWNEFFAPLILISDPGSSPLPVAIAILRQQTMGVIDYGATEAGVVVMALPAVIMFLILQRYYVKGFMSGAVKG